MTVTKALVVLVLVSACDSPGRRAQDAAPIDVVGEPIPPPPDAAPPPFDAAPLPEMACTDEPDAGMQCLLPKSTCLDQYYLTYYTGGTCTDSKCSFEEHWLYCYAGCWKNVSGDGNDGCSPGFT